jgi:hypothetical protein
VLWRRDPTRTLPIASLTKMMTALVVDGRTGSRDRVRISKRALDYSGSGMGVLSLGKRITVNTMLHGLLLSSGNDAARALAEHTGGDLPGFTRLMNRQAAEMGLGCTHFTSVDGLRNRGNHSCAADLAALGRAVLRRPRLARIVRRRSAVLPFPIKGGRVYLYNSIPAAPGLPGHDRPQDRLHEGGGTMPRGHRDARPPAPRRRAAALARSGQAGDAVARPGIPRRAPMTGHSSGSGPRPYPWTDAR